MTKLFAANSRQGAQAKRRRTAFTSNQISTLEKTFAKERYLSKMKRHDMAHELGVADRTLKVWFQNRRMKEKRDKEAIQKYKGSGVNSVSDQSETSSMISDTSVYSNNKNIQKDTYNNGFVPNAYQNDKNAGVQQHVQQYVGKSVANTVQPYGSNVNDSKSVGSTVPHYGNNFNDNFGYSSNFGYGSNYDSFFDPYLGYNFGSSFENMFSNFGNPNYYNQPGGPPMPMANTTALQNPTNLECNSGQFVGPMVFNENVPL